MTLSCWFSQYTLPRTQAWALIVLRDKHERGRDRQERGGNLSSEMNDSFDLLSLKAGHRKVKPEQSVDPVQQGVGGELQSGAEATRRSGKYETVNPQKNL